MLRINIEPVGDFSSLAQRWQALEASSEGGFFRSWTFLGCQAESRFADARLLSATLGGTDMALALIGGRRGRGWLNETGDRVADSVFIEHNGLLVRRGHEAVVAPVLRHALRAVGSLVLSGIDDAVLSEARKAGWVDLRQTRFAPCVNLAGLQGRFLDTLSANARAQIRRSMRLYGPGLRLERASTLDQALAFFEEMVELHQAAWQRRGQPGAFAEPVISRFHQALIARAWPAARLDLLRIGSGVRHVGTLYTFISNGHVLSYQSGFAFDGGDARVKPGLVCHAMAIEAYAARGMREYDLLAGAERYKTTLTPAGRSMHWGVLHGSWSARHATGWLAAAARRIRSRLH